MSKGSTHRLKITVRAVKLTKTKLQTMSKKYTQHKWCAIVQIPLTEEEARIGMVNGTIPKDVTAKDIEFTGVGCFNCELEVQEAWGKPCVPGSGTI